MLTKNEITALSLSPTKKDFVQIWNELLEVAGKLSERWDPTSTNESDPGIVILKALTGIADKLNYNIDKNTLEAFMPTAAQEDSMRKLCDMLGYNIKYYRSAETNVTIKYYNNDPSEEEAAALKDGLLIPKFTVITNSDKDISYFTTNQVPRYISSVSPVTDPPIPCMEGQIVKCESTADNNVITASQISNNRFYLPEAQIAENGIFIYNISSANIGTDSTPDWALADGTPWEKVDNLNIQSRGERVFKFGYDSYESRPYVEFPSDYSELINDGLFIYYARTSGANGNVSPRTLTQFEKPSGDDWNAIPVESFSVENTFAATTGANIETIKQAYNNFKKTVGTFETLVTCRDYMNKIYSLTDDIGRPLVSNVLVTDIRNDLNRAITICSCEDAGIFYKETPLTNTTTVTKTVKTPAGDLISGELEVEEPAIDYFDLVLYPFKSYSQIKNNVKDIQETYDSSFRYDVKSFNVLKRDLDEQQAKTIAHNIIPPEQDDIVCINNYLRISAIIGTNTKITTEEGTLLKEVIKIALANAFNMRELDFGEEIPFESIVEVIENADSRIKVVSLNEPALYTTFSVIDSYDAYDDPVIKEYAVASEWFTEEDADASGRFEIQKDAEGNYTDGTFNTKKAKEIYNKLAVRNVLAGRLPLFKYNTVFGTSFSDGAYRVTKNILDNIPDALEEPSSTTPNTIYTDGAKIYAGQYIPLAAQPTELLAEPSQETPDTSYTDMDEKVQYIGKLVDDSPVYAKIIYTETAVPEKYAGNIVVKDSGDDNNITEIETSCEISASDEGNGYKKVSDVTLSAGEFIKFRAPNFVTKKTYPAYVNYHLALNKELITNAASAEAETLFSLLNADGTRARNWEKVFNYFGSLNKTKTFTLVQNVSKGSNSKPETSVPGLTIDNPTVEDIRETPRTIIAKSGCIKLGNNGNPIIVGADGVRSEVLNLQVILSNDTPFISNVTVLDTIQNSVNTAILNLPADALPDGEWSIAYEFEYVPFEANTLAAWEKFIRQEGKGLFGFTPAENAETVLWRAYGDNYVIGKFILDTGAKLLPFTTAYFGALDSLYSRLHGIYIARDLGRDVDANIITNNTEYELKQNEYLYIEYTPAITTEDGTSQTQEPVKEIYGPGTIIRPNGFETGLMDSSVYATKGHSALKNVTFDNIANEIPLFSFGANEQVEIRERSQTVLNKDLFTNSSTIYVYKNFNNCPELETISNTGSGLEKGKRINNSYTLKDGEYIFYTDQNKAEFAYFTSGTEVTLTGKAVLPSAVEIIDLAVIFDSGIQQIPWSPLSFSNSAATQEADSVIFQEYQYITLGPGDTLDKLALVNVNNDCINSTWQYCKDVKYTPAGGTSLTLDPINVASTGGEGCGWEVSSVLELAVSPNTSQVLRTTDKVQTSLTLHKTSASGVIDQERDIKIVAEEDSPLSFKTNVACQSSTGNVKLSELYTNTNNAKSFELKIFADKAPAIVNTVHNTLVKYTGEVLVEDQTKASAITLAGYNELWNRVTLETFKTSSTEYDKAIELSVSVLPNTYGVFSIYIDYGKTSGSSKTWLELLPGMATSNITLFNANATWEVKDENGNDINPRLILNPGLNCVRVNTTCDIYIKTDGMYGTIYFDDLRLVDAYVEYEENGTKVRQATNGLNLSQIGYLYADEAANDSFNVFDAKVRKQLKANYRDEALQQLNEKEQEYKTSISLESNKIFANNAKVQKILTFINNTISELELLQKADDSDTVYRTQEYLTGLFDKFNEISEDLDKEIALKEALVNNKAIDELEQRLVDLLSDSLQLATAKQELVDNLEKLRDAATENADKFKDLPKEDIIADALSYDNAEDSTLIDEISLTSLLMVDAQHHSELSALSAELDEVASTKTDLEAALNAVYTKKQAEVIERLESLIKAANGSLSAIMSNISIAVSSDIDYQEAARLLLELRRQAKRLDIQDIIDNLTVAAEFGLYAEFASEAERLKTVLIAEDTKLLNDIDAVLALVHAKVTSNATAPDGTITTAVNTIKDDIDTRDEAGLMNILGELATIAATADRTYSTCMDSISESNDAQIKDLAARLAQLVTDRSNKVESISGFSSIENYVDLPYGEEALLAVWPKRMRIALISEVDGLCHSVRVALEKGGVKLVFSTRATGELFSRAINTEAFSELFTQANYIAQDMLQNTRREQLIEELSTKIDLAPEILNAIDNGDTGIKNDETIANRNATLIYIVNRLRDATASKPKAAEKRQLLKKLDEELEKAIQLDTELLSITAGMLCPSLLTFESKYSEMQTDNFYERVRDFVTSAKASLLTSTDYDEDIAVLLDGDGDEEIGLRGYSERLTSILNDLATLDSLETWLSDNTTVIDTLTSALLTYEFAGEVNSLKEKFNMQKELAQIKDCNLIKCLDDDLVVAWQVGTRWVDGGGNTLINTAGKWYDNNNEEITVMLTRDNEKRWKYNGVELTEDTLWAVGQEKINISDDSVSTILSSLYSKLKEIEAGVAVPKEVSDLLTLENMLLAEIRAIDKNRSFYYNIPIEPNVAIDFTESDAKLNNLMNPAVNYDINNVNNPFVISKLDINYLTNGLQIARSSRIS